MILIGIGSNLPGPAGSPLETCRAALSRLASRGLAVAAVSRWYETSPVPSSDQPNFVNGVARVETALEPTALLALLHEVEADLDRRRTVPNAPRTIDLDLLDYDGRVRREQGGVILPHPRLHERAFVLLPLAEVAPGWHHPESGRSLDDLIAALPEDQFIRAVREPL